MKNKTLIALVAALAGTVLQANATISINWATLSNSIYQNDGVTPIASGSIVQLIWSPDAVINPIDHNNPLVPQGNDILLDSSTSPIAGLITDGVGTYMGENYGQGADGLVSGYVYTRAFSSATPGAGDYYNDGGFVGGPLNDQDPPGPPPNNSDASGLVLSNLIVPEPSVLAFFGIGGLMMAVRRRLKA